MKDNPAYLLLFALGLLGGALGFGATAIGTYRGNTTLIILGFATRALLLGATLFVIRLVESRRVEHTNEPTDLEILDQVRK
ncbi:MAG: hypothetical protein SCH70_11625 [Candidatus Methanoperedens sp.]|nr:hypothetical protein [Candidatus Methanoperedens sp.]